MMKEKIQTLEIQAKANSTNAQDIQVTPAQNADHKPIFHFNTQGCPHYSTRQTNSAPVEPCLQQTHQKVTQPTK